MKKLPGPIAKQLLYFVGREEAIHEVQESLQHIGYLYVDEAKGVEGIGKTTLLAKLYESVSEEGKYHPVWVSMDRYDPAGKGGTGDRASLSTLVNNLHEYWLLLKALTKDLPDQSFADFAMKVDTLYKTSVANLLNRNVKVNLGGVTVKTGDVHIGMLSRVVEGTLKTGDVVIEVKVPDDTIKVADDAIRMAINQMRDAATQEFTQCLNSLGDDFRVIMFVDDFHKVMNQDLGKWVLSELASQLNNSVLVVSRTESSQKLDILRDWVVDLPLNNFSLQQVEAYLEKRLTLSLLPEGLTQRIYEFSGGHPQAVALAAVVVDLARKKGLDGPELLRKLDNIPAERAAQIGDLVERIIEAIDDEDVVKALEAGWVVRRFDADLLRYLITGLEAEDEDDEAVLGQYQDIITRLEEYSFTERHPPGKHPPEYYKFHDFIRHEKEQHQIKNNPKRHQEIHRRAADYYGARLIEYEEEHHDATTYLRWFRYENPGWLDMKTEWLYHLARSQDRTAAHLAFAKVYFDAFWWWGCYITFPFCERLLTEWGQTQRLEEDENFLGLIRKFHNSYPTGYDKRGKGDWRQVEMALRRLRKQLKVDGKVSKLDDDHRHLRAITNIFLADAHRYQEQDNKRADQYLQEAYELFVEADDSWNMTWGLHELANLYVDRKQDDKALEMCQRALELAFDEEPAERDYEVIANLRRIQADARWQQGDLNHAFHNYALAIFCAYAFHGLPTLDDAPTAPDFYTLAFHQEMVERTLARLKNLWDTGQKTEAVRAGTRLHEFFAPYWALVGKPSTSPDIKTLLGKNQLEDLTAYLFPQKPKEEDLGRIDTDYVDQVNDLVKKMSDQIEADT